MRALSVNVVLAFAILSILFTGFYQKRGSKTISGKTSAKNVSFKKDIMPVFRKYCLPCHTEDQMNPSELYLESYGDLMKGGKHGSPISPGKPDSSLMVQKLSPTPPFGERMPYKAKTPLPDDTLTILKRWISEGAKNN